MGLAEKTYEMIAIEALSLSVPERRDLLGRLLKSLDENTYVDPEQLRISEERLQAMREGKLQTYPYEVVMEQIRTKYGL